MPTGIFIPAPAAVFAVRPVSNDQRRFAIQIDHRQHPGTVAALQKDAGAGKTATGI